MAVIALDALGVGEMGGGRSATLNLLRKLLRQDTANRYLLLVNRPEPELLTLGEHVRQELVPVQHRMLCRGWAQVRWPLAFRRRQVDLVHHMKNLATLGLPGRTVVTMYDMTMLVHPEMFPASEVLYWRHVQPLTLRQADCIVAISQQTARDVARLYRLPLDAIRVIYPGYDPRFRRLPDESVAAVRQRYGTGSRFILHVGSISRKKNLLTLLRAYEKLCTWGYDGRLVMVGREYGKAYDQLFYTHLESSRVRARVLLTGAVPDDDLPALYNAADVMVFPSLHEGFGLVPVEAMACGAPLIVSNGGALPEVIGDGGIILEDILDAEEIARAADRLLGNATYRAAQIARGLQRATRYTADVAASQTLALYQELLG